MASTASAASPDMPTLRLGILPVLDTLPLFVANDEGFFTEEGLSVELIPFNSALERDAALKGGSLDGYFGDLLNTILLNSSGEDLRIIATSYHTHPQHRMFALLASPKSGITSIQEAKNVPVAISIASIIEYLLEEIMTREGIASEDIKKLEMRMIPIRYQMLIGNSIKLALLPEPLASKAVVEGAIPIADDRKLDTTLTILAVKETHLTGNRTLLPRFLRAYSKSVTLINNNPLRFMDTIINKTRFPVSLKESFVMPTLPAPVPPSRADVARVVDWLLQRNLIPGQIPYEEIVWSGTKRE